MIISCLAFSIIAQASADTAMNKKVSLEVMRAPLRNILGDLSKQTGFKLSYRPFVPAGPQWAVGPRGSKLMGDPAIRCNGDLCTTVLVKDRPLRDVLRSLASVHGYELVEETDRAFLVPSRALTWQNDYIPLENKLLMEKARAKLWALSKLVHQPFGSYEIVSENGRSDESPDDWAKRHINTWPYYLAGMWRALPINNPNEPQIWRTEGFWVGPNDTQAQAKHGRAWVNNQSAELAGHQALFVITPITYQLRVTGIYPVGVPPEPSPTLPYRYPRIPAEIPPTKFSQYLNTWEADDQALSAPELIKPTPIAASTSPETWMDGSNSLAGILYSLHKEVGVSIVADAYRMASRRRPEAVSGKNPKEWLLKFKANEQCYLGYRNQIVEVRHPAFWRLQETEPTYASLSQIESAAQKRRLTLMDYARFMASNGQEISVRFDSADSGLYNFHVNPLAANALVFLALGRMPDSQLKSLYAGERVASAASPDFNRAAEMGPFYSGTLAGIPRLLLQEVNHRQLPGYVQERGYYNLLRPFKERERFGPVSGEWGLGSSYVMLGNSVWAKNITPQSMTLFFGFLEDDFVRFDLHTQ